MAYKYGAEVTKRFNPGNLIIAHLSKKGITLGSRRVITIKRMFAYVLIPPRETAASIALVLFLTPSFR
jgi:hypothetical protein